MSKIKQIDIPERVDLEPFFVAQTGECKTNEERQAWVTKVAAEARARGAVHGRVTLGCEGHPDLLLFESWNVPPTNEGNPRFQLPGEP